MTIFTHDPSSFQQGWLPVHVMIDQRWVAEVVIHDTTPLLLLLKQQL
jgi:hypothetical protein